MSDEGLGIIGAEQTLVQLRLVAECCCMHTLHLHTSYSFRREGLQSKVTFITEYTDHQWTLFGLK